MSLWLCEVLPEGSLISGFWVSEMALICKPGEELIFPLQQLTSMFCLPRLDCFWGVGVGGIGVSYKPSHIQISHLPILPFVHQIYQPSAGTRESSNYVHFALERSGTIWPLQFLSNIIPFILKTPCIPKSQPRLQRKAIPRLLKDADASLRHSSAFENHICAMQLHGRRLDFVITWLLFQCWLCCLLWQ